MAYTDKDQQRQDEESAGSRVSSSGEAAEEAQQEYASNRADAGAAPEQTGKGSEGTKRGSDQQDPAATYEPDKKKSERETL